MDANDAMSTEDNSKTFVKADNHDLSRSPQAASENKEGFSAKGPKNDFPHFGDFDERFYNDAIEDRDLIPNINPRLPENHNSLMPNAANANDLKESDEYRALKKDNSEEDRDHDPFRTPGL